MRPAITLPDSCRAIRRLPTRARHRAATAIASAASVLHVINNQGWSLSVACARAITMGTGFSARAMAVRPGKASSRASAVTPSAIVYRATPRWAGVATTPMAPDSTPSGSGARTSRCAPCATARPSPRSKLTRDSRPLHRSTPIFSTATRAVARAGSRRKPSAACSPGSEPVSEREIRWPPALVRVRNGGCLFSFTHSSTPIHTRSARLQSLRRQSH